MLEVRLDQAASYVLRDFLRLGPGSSLCNEARQVGACGHESAFVQRLDP
jgi:hypothetical protein